ncbi:MAG: hypothetical protein V5A88_06700 [Candidatus Thermoplasmatota archaeon]
MRIGWSEFGLIIFALLLSAIHLKSKKLSKLIERAHINWLSLGGGSLLATLFLVFLPHVVQGESELHVYPLMLIGFASFFLSEKYLYQHVKDESTLEEDIYHLHVIGFFIDHSVKGFVLVAIINLRPILGFLTVLPFFIHTLASTIAMENLHRISGSTFDKYLLSSSVLIGTLAGILLDISLKLERAILAFALGILLFLVSRDVLPKEKEGNPMYFVLGMAVIFIFWLLLELLLI